MTLEQQARAELLQAKLALILSELDELKADVKLEEDKFEEDFQDYLDSKEDYVRLTNEDGEVVWINKSFIKIGEGDLLMDMPDHVFPLPDDVPNTVFTPLDDMPSNVFTTKPACHGICLCEEEDEERRLTAMVNDELALTLGYTMEQLPDWAKGL